MFNENSNVSTNQPAVYRFTTHEDSNGASCFGCAFVPSRSPQKCPLVVNITQSLTRPRAQPRSLIHTFVEKFLVLGGKGLGGPTWPWRHKEYSESETKSKSPPADHNHRNGNLIRYFKNGGGTSTSIKHPSPALDTSSKHKQPKVDQLGSKNTWFEQHV